MAGSAQISETEKLRLDLFFCPYQPGRLQISKKACVSRYMLAQELEHSSPKDAFDMVRKTGLDICRNCSHGRYLARRFEK